MTDPVSLGSQRDAIAARRLCDELGFCIDGKGENIIAAALTGLISMLPTELQMHIAHQLNERLVASVQLPPATNQTIDAIVKGNA